MMNLPNQITLTRLILSVVFFVVLSQYSQRTPKPWLLDLAAGIFIIAALSDFLDGYLARAWNQVTALGRILDPLADKVLVCGAFILFCGSNFADAEGKNVTGVSAWMVVIIVTRELLITGLRGFNEAQGKAFGASVHGKVKMWAQSIAAPAILLIVAHHDGITAAPFWDYVKLGLIWITVIVTALSVIQYLIRSRYILTESFCS